jgi:hypothetical protein
MNKNEHIDKLVDDTLNSLDGAGRATPRAYLFTRLNARMQNNKEGIWDKTLRFVSRPAVAMAVLCLVICINALVVTRNYPGKATGSATEETSYASVYEYNNSVAVLDDIENTEP